MFLYVALSSVVVLLLLRLSSYRLRRVDEPHTVVTDFSAVCRFCRQEISGIGADFLACVTCRETLEARDEYALTSMREAAPPLFEDTVSGPYRPGEPFVRLSAPSIRGFGNNRPGVTHTTSLREFLQYPTLHRERFIAAAMAELSVPAELSQETVSEGVTRFVLANPERTYRAHRPRSLGMNSVGRMDCYITSSSSRRVKVKQYSVAVVHFVFAAAADVSIHESSHSDFDAAKREALQHLRKRYREVTHAAEAVVADLLGDTPSDAVSVDRARTDLYNVAVVLVGQEKAGWLVDLAVDWDGTLHNLVGYVREFESKTQVLLVKSMLPDWSLSRRKLVQAVRELAPSEPGKEASLCPPQMLKPRETTTGYSS